MKKNTLIIALIMSLLLNSKEAMAIFDPMATIESALELKDEVVTQVQEVQKFKSDMDKRLKQGYAMATSCFKNPAKCGLKEITKLSKNGTKKINDDIKTIKKFPVMSGASEIIGKIDYTTTGDEGLNDVIRSTYIYTRGKNSMQNLRENRDDINSVISNKSAILFAKGAVIRTRLQNENDNEIYEDPSVKNQVDSIKYLQSKLDINDNTRLARILEIKAYILDAQYTAELTQQSNKQGED